MAKTLWLIVISAVVLSACQTISPSSQTQTEPSQTGLEGPAALVNAEPDLEPSPPNRTETTSNPSKPALTQAEPAEPPKPEDVVTRLQQEALLLQSEGQWAAAEQKLERALRIEASKIDLYHQLATVRLGQKRFTEAEQIALKGLTLTDESPKFKASLWEVIAQCRSANGDVEGAEAAREEMLRWMRD